MKFIPDDMNGMPDRLILVPNNMCVWVELKTKGGKLEPLQKYMHAKLRVAGQSVYVVWTKAQVDECIEEIKKAYAV